ncbi:hypothetical protein [Nocardia abscessus]|uniref:hypothetical protein n=1 Tax=Nocardia abscessus TaxID=120957 RepID=UPI0024562AFE|nr:hypothetical protein [Nocardia abscessus]
MRTGRGIRHRLAHVEARHWWQRPLRIRRPLPTAAPRARTDAVIATLAVRLARSARLNGG